VLARPGGRASDRTGGAAESRRGRGLEHAVDRHERRPGHAVLVAGRLIEGENGRKAGLQRLQQLHPLLPGTGPEDDREAIPHGRPRGLVQLRGQLVQGQPERLDQDPVELRLVRRHRHPAAVGGLVGPVKRSAAVEPVRLPAVVPRADLSQSVEVRPQQGDTVDHGGVEDLPSVRARCLKQASHDPEREEHPAAAEITDEVEGRHRAALRRADRVQQAGDREVVEVMTGSRRQRPLLAPSGHPAVDQPWIALQALIRADPQPLGHPGPAALDEGVGLLDEAQHDLGARRVLQVDSDREPAAAVDEVDRARAVRVVAYVVGPVHPDHLGAHVAEHHRAPGAGTDRRDLDDLDTFERAHLSSVFGGTCLSSVFSCT
jgi:hypothetical protein